MKTKLGIMDIAEYLNTLVDQAERDKFLQEILGMGFKYPFNCLEYVRPSRHSKGYIRKKPSTYTNPTEAQGKARLRFGKTAYSLYGLKGTTETPDKRIISRIAREVGNRVKGSEFKDSTPIQIMRLRRVLKGIEKKIIFLPAMPIEI